MRGPVPAIAETTSAASAASGAAFVLIQVMRELSVHSPDIGAIGSTIGTRYDVHQLGDLASLLCAVSGGDGILDAMGNMVLQDFFFRPSECRAHRSDLRDDIDAVAIVFNHASKAADLAFDPAEPL
jgi:hypothetical protein